MSEHSDKNDGPSRTMRFKDGSSVVDGVMQPPSFGDGGGATPRTDAAVWMTGEGRGAMDEVVHANFARQLERELADYKRLNAGLIEGIAAHKAALSSNVPPEITPAMVDAVNALDGWSGFTLDDLKLLVATMRSAQPEELFKDAKMGATLNEDGSVTPATPVSPQRDHR